MRFVLTPIGSAGDVYPFVGLGRVLLERGHSVKIITSSYFEPLIRKSGLEFQSMGTREQFVEVLQNPDLWHPTRGFKIVIAALLKELPKLQRALEEEATAGPMVVVAHPLDLASRILQDKMGLAVVSMQLAPIMFRSLHQVPVLRGEQDFSWTPKVFKKFMWWVADRIVIDPVIGPMINRMRRDVGLGPISRVFKAWIHSPLLTIGLFPEWFAPVQPDWPTQLRLTSFPLFDEQGVSDVGADMDSFLEKRPIVFTPGSANIHAHKFFEAAMMACRTLGRPGMLLSRFREQIPTNLPENVRHFEFAPLSQILARCAAIVHHGGVGTTAAGLAGGVPHIIMPLSHDQPDHAARIKRLGVGAPLLPKKFTGPALTMALRGILDSPDVAMRCAELKSKCAARNGLVETAELLEKISPLTQRR